MYPYIGAVKSLIQLRSLEYGLDTPLLNFSTLVVYHPNEGNGHTFASLTWTGFIGGLTVYSGFTAVSEKACALSSKRR